MKLVKKVALCVLFPLMCGTAAVSVAGNVDPFTEMSVFNKYEAMALEKMPKAKQKEAFEMKKKMMMMEMKHEKEMMEMRNLLLELYGNYLG